MGLLSLRIQAYLRQYHCYESPSSDGFMPKLLDRLDRRILDELQSNARVSNQELAQRVGLSPAPCWRRLRRLEEEGFIAGYATLLSAPAIGLPIQAYALISLENHHPQTVRQFDQLVRERPEVLECHSMSGPNDYLLRIVAASMEAYEQFLSTRVLQLPGVRSVNTSFVLRTKKFTTRLPVADPEPSPGTLSARAGRSQRTPR
jgi:DNA-binding Lrp family transcriptional regulator